jgi:hypothetical protein
MSDTVFATVCIAVIIAATLWLVYHLLFIF